MATLTTKDAIPEHLRTYYRSMGYWGRPKLTTYLAWTAAERPLTKAVIDPRGQTISYGQLDAMVNRMSNGLAALGLRKGDVIAVQLPNWLEYCVTHLAATRLGLVTLFMIPSLRAHEVKFIFSHASPKVAVIPGRVRGFSFIDMYESLRSGVDSLSHIVVVDGDERQELPVGMTPYSDFIAAASQAPAPECPVGESDPEFMVFSSGTSSDPKGMQHTYRSANFVLHMWPRLLGLDQRDVIFCPVTLGHPAGCQYGLRLAVTIGAPLVLMDRWRPDEAVDVIEREGCTHSMIALAQAEDLLNLPGLRKEAFRTFRHWVFGGARIRPTLVTDFEHAVGGAVLRVYGMSEHFGSALVRPYDPIEKRINTEGRPVPGNEFRIMDDDGKDLPVGQAGELAYRGPALIDGYFTSEVETAKAFINGWQLTGDLGRIDDDGFLTIVDRKKDIVIRGGENISPLEIENVLASHPRIAEIAVIGYPDDRLGERVCAVIVPKQGESVALEDITQFLTEREVARYKHPERLELVAAFPHTSIGKIKKEEVRQWYR